MVLGDWFRRLFRRRRRQWDEIPEVVGHMTDEHGRKVEIHRGPLRHESLLPDQLQRIGRLHEVLVEAYPMTLAGWIDGFRRDANPESEIRIIEACAVVYQRLTAQAVLSPEEKQRLYGVLCLLTAGEIDPKLASALPAGKGLPDLESIAAVFREAWRNGARP
jgi:hypothetical protein